MRVFSLNIVTQSIVKMTVKVVNKSQKQLIHNCIGVRAEMTFNENIVAGRKILSSNFYYHTNYDIH